MQTIRDVGPRFIIETNEIKTDTWKNLKMKMKRQSSAKKVATLSIVCSITTSW